MYKVYEARAGDLTCFGVSVDMTEGVHELLLQYRDNADLDGTWYLWGDGGMVICIASAASTLGVTVNSELGSFKVLYGLDALLDNFNGDISFCAEEYKHDQN